MIIGAALCGFASIFFGWVFNFKKKILDDRPPSRQPSLYSPKPAVNIFHQYSKSYYDWWHAEPAESIAKCSISDVNSL